MNCAHCLIYKGWCLCCFHDSSRHKEKLQVGAGFPHVATPTLGETVPNFQIAHQWESLLVAGEAETCSWQDCPVCWRTLRGAPGKLLLFVSGQVSASGLFLFPKHTDNISCLSAATWRCMSTRHFQVKVWMLAHGLWGTAVCGGRGMMAAQ